MGKKCVSVRQLGMCQNWWDWTPKTEGLTTCWEQKCPYQCWALEALRFNLICLMPTAILVVKDVMAFGQNLSNGSSPSDPI